MLYIHCGLHKTGSSSVQEALAAYRLEDARYADRGYYYLTELATHKSWARRVEKISRSADVILSCEAALGNMGDVYSDYKEKIECLVDMFAGCEVKLVIVFRDQLTWLNSVYAQTIQEGHYTLPSEFLESIIEKENLRYKIFIEGIEKAASSMTVSMIPYSKSIVEDVTTAMNIKVTRSVDIKPAKRNKSLSGRSLMVMRAVNKIASPKESQQMRQILQGISSEEESGEMKFMSFDAEQRRIIREKFESDWQWFVENYSCNEGSEANKAKAFYKTEEFGVWEGEERQVEEMALQSLSVLRYCNSHGDTERTPTLYSKIRRKLHEISVGGI